MPARRKPRPPPLGGLFAFDAILRHGSFSVAADELALTQSAVSHRLKTLERHYGTALLERLNPGLRPTAAGARLAREIAPFFELLERAGTLDADDARTRPFRLGVGQSLLALWLSPRLSALRAAFPAQPLEIVVLTRAADAKRRDLDLTLLWLARADVPRDETVLRFPDEAVFPVAAPALLRAKRPARGRDWRDLALIDKRAGESDGAADEWSWSTWLGAAPRRRPDLTFREIAGSLQAALEGQGAALTRSLLAADALKSRRLRALIDLGEARPSSKVQIARWHAGSHPQAAAMARWLVAAARTALAQSGAAPERAPHSSPDRLDNDGVRR